MRLRAPLFAALLALALFAEAQLAGFTVVRTYGPVTLTAGADNYLPSAAGQALPDGVTQLLVRNQQVSWPLAGGQGLDFAIEYSLDGGNSWQFAAGDSIDDVQQGGIRGVPFGETRQVASIPEGVSRRARLHYHFYKTLRVQGTIEAQ